MCQGSIIPLHIHRIVFPLGNMKSVEDITGNTPICTIPCIIRKRPMHLRVKGTKLHVCSKKWQMRIIYQTKAVSTKFLSRLSSILAPGSERKVNVAKGINKLPRTMPIMVDVDKHQNLQIRTIRCYRQTRIAYQSPRLTQRHL